jgi:hypothetical protein
MSRSSETAESAARPGRRGRQAPGQLCGVCLVASLLTVACELTGEGADFFYVCPDPGPEVAALPDRLSATGLYEDIASDRVAPGITAFRPAFELWSDGADKRRWLWLPPGTRIDSSDMNDWSFPVGARIWKEFRRDGVRVETRLIERIGPRAGEWVAQAYVWSDDEEDAFAAASGFVNARGTDHNVPAAGECIGCHGGRSSFVLGVSAIQLSLEARPGELDLWDLVERDLLSDPPAASFVVPGDDTERAALGYLHANCGSCHNQARPPAQVAPCFDPDNRLDFWLTVDRLASPEETPTYESAIGFKIEPGRPDRSAVIDHMSTRGLFFPLRMPPIGSEKVDGHGIDIVRRWIAELD